MDFSLWKYPALFATRPVAGIVDSIAGGGGLITLPVLLGFGVDPQIALGTNKLQGSFGSGSAIIHHARAKVLHLHDCWLGICCTLIATFLGARSVLLLDPSLLKQLIPFLFLDRCVDRRASRHQKRRQIYPPDFHRRRPRPYRQTLPRQSPEIKWAAWPSTPCLGSSILSGAVYAPDSENLKQTEENPPLQEIFPCLLRISWHPMLRSAIDARRNPGQHSSTNVQVLHHHADLLRQ